MEKGIELKKKQKWLISALLLLCFCYVFSEGKTKEKQEGQNVSLCRVLNDKMQEITCQTYFPVFSFLEENEKREKDTTLFEVIFGGCMPLYAYTELYGAVPVQTEDGVMELAEGKSLHEKDREMELDLDMIEAVKRENENMDLTGEQEKEKGTEKQEEAEEQSTFKEAEKTASINRDALQEFDQLVSEFYAVDSTTYIGRDQLNFKKLSEPDMTLQQKDASKPQILIYHTHSQEAFQDSVPGEDDTTIIGAGEKLAQRLEEYGFHVLHHTGKYDVESRDYAYSNAAPAIEQILAENPEIEVIIDLHRDQMPEDTRLVTEIDGRPTARFMFFNGLSRTNKTGEIDYLKNPNLDANLAFSFQMQMAAREYYPGLTRKIYLKGYRYNMHYREKSLLIELGAQNNTVEEIMNACDPLAHILALVLLGEA